MQPVSPVMTTPQSSYPSRLGQHAPRQAMDLAQLKTKLTRTTPYNEAYFKYLLQDEKPDCLDRLIIPAVQYIHQAAIKKDPSMVTVGTLKTRNGIKAVRLEDVNKHVARLLVIDDKPEPQTVGLVYADGSLKLENETRDKPFWNEDRLWIDTTKVALSGRVGMHLVQQAIKQSAVGSMLPTMQKQVHQAMGITGKGVRSLTLDVTPAHAKTVSAIMNDPKQGLAPGLDNTVVYTPDITQCLPVVTSLDEAKSLSLDSLEKRIAAGFCQSFKGINQALSTVLQSSTSLPDVINISQTLNATQYYKMLDAWVQQPMIKNLSTTLSDTPPNPLYGYLSKTQGNHSVASAQATVNVVDNVLLHNPDVQQALKQYQAVTQQLANKGVTVVVAAGNENQIVPDQVQAHPDALINWLTKSPSVITVGGSYTGAKPWQFSQHQPAAFSNAALAANKPTLTAPAVLIPTTTKQFGLERPAFVCGTSFAAPFVAGVVALMKEANPLLSSRQIQHYLRQACENPHQHADHKVGAGYLNPIVAVQLAQRSALEKRPSRGADVSGSGVLRGMAK
jgi:hypothetical protein